jgi:hypothetical protein
VQIEAVKSALASRSDACFLCKWILKDLDMNGKLTDWPPNANLVEKPLFPAKAKEAHLKLERISLDS